MADIVICYAQENRRQVEQLEEAFNLNRWKVWWDRYMHAGGSMDGAVRKEIGRARCVVVIWSKEAAKSMWVPGEATLAFAQRKLVMVRVDDTDLPLKFYDLHAPILEPHNLAESSSFESVIVSVYRGGELPSSAL